MWIKNYVWRIVENKKIALPLATAWLTINQLGVAKVDDSISAISDGIIKPVIESVSSIIKWISNNWDISNIALSSASNSVWYSALWATLWTSATFLWTWILARKILQELGIKSELNKNIWAIWTMLWVGAVWTSVALPYIISRAVWLWLVKLTGLWINKAKKDFPKIFKSKSSK